MLARFRARLTYANVVATLALFVALGGTGYAASQITSRDVKNRSLKGGDLKKNTVTGTEIRESRLGRVPAADNAVTADVSKTAGSATTAGSAGVADVANVANDAQQLAGQGVGAFERSSRTQFGKASAAPAGVSGETVVLSWPELGAQVTSASPVNGTCDGGNDIRVAIKNTKTSGSAIEVFQPDTNGGVGGQPVVSPGGKSYMCPESGDESLETALTDSSGKTLFVQCLTGNNELRCIGTRSEP
jgi:hypothetical protein